MRDRQIELNYLNNVWGRKTKQLVSTNFTRLAEGSQSYPVMGTMQLNGHIYSHLDHLPTFINVWMEKHLGGAILHGNLKCI